MGGGSQAKEHPYEYIIASALAATINYPLWRASAIGQSGFRVTSTTFCGGGTLCGRFVTTLPPSITPYLHAFAPPYKGMCATIIGMTWARAAIFWGSDRGKELLQTSFPTLPPLLSTIIPPLFLSIGIQCINQPIVRASITLQNPESNLPNIRRSIQWIYGEYGVKGLWHGTSAGVLKTVPKYCTAILAKDYMDQILPPPDPHDPTSNLYRSAYKSAVAGIAGAALTNPLDVIRNEMFKTNQPLVDTVGSLRAEMGWMFVWRGMGKNLVAVSIPLASTLFFTDALIDYTEGRK
eukprot:CAMPEP_0198265478 /NCGR_PEP_ID=MMETSP1447-20131203/22719_1 /TAXON_ID=420782 /ORGANISM="Chaetoceros dichaeta, Strain CCMP1751" /LENGTH=292 /DNA_ID=CAMNT_0043954995 /DNA_START=40 /DNA_END=915 /DNA_ORIENTATION=+